ncbi:ABC transporter permease subunit [Pantoea ananatis]
MAQRNLLVAALAMGFALVPLIFTLAEDALFSVPASLGQGSLALGATPWQTLTRVVLPGASAGIFAALMIGFGRAVGETMILLMATGNTPQVKAACSAACVRFPPTSRSRCLKRPWAAPITEFCS